MLKETELKEKLTASAQAEFRPGENDDLSELIPAMLTYIGSTDSKLRDELIYSALNAWILRYKAINPEQLRKLLPIILDEQHLLYKLGEQETDSVFTRSFSMLVLPLLLITHRSQPLFSAAEIHRIKEQLLYYLAHEKDCRGFVPGKGWAHAIAHAADALDDLAQCAEMSKSDLTEILEAIRSVVCVESASYVFMEDERLLVAVMAILRADRLPDLEIRHWIEGFSDLALKVKSSPEKYVMYGNVKNFLQSFYFRLQWAGMTNRFETVIDQTLRQINPFARQATAD